MNDENQKNNESGPPVQPTLAEIMDEVKQEQAAEKTAATKESIQKEAAPVQSVISKETPGNPNLPSPSSDHRGLKIAGGVTAGLVAVVLASLAGFLYLYGGIFPGVKAGELSLSGMTPGAAQSAIESHCGQSLTGKSIDLVIHDKTYPIAINEVAHGIDSSASAKTAYSYGRTGGFFTRAGQVLTGIFGGYEVPLSVSLDDDAIAKKLNLILEKALNPPVQPDYKIAGDFLVLTTGKAGVDFDKNEVLGIVTEKIREMDFKPLEVSVKLEQQSKPDLDKIAAEVNREPKNASVDKTDKTYQTILPEQHGVQMDVNKAKEIVGDASKQTYKIPVTVTKAEVTESQLRTLLFRDVLVTQSTTLNANQKDRTSNVRLSAQFVNGTILNPDDEFSYNTIVGPRNYARGFKDAKVFASGEVVDGVGGGICQTSTTIYMAALKADLKISSRRNHMFAVSYAPLGEDATVAYGSQDFKFVNNTPYPIKIQAYLSGNRLTVSLIGTKTDDKNVTLSTEILSKTPFAVVEKNDDTLEKGKRKTEQGGYTGYKTVTYKTVTVNGKSTKTKVNTSTYSKLDKIVLVGTKDSSKAPNTDPSATQPQSDEEKTPVSQTAVPGAALNQFSDPENA